MSLLNLKSQSGSRKRKKRIGRGNSSGHGTYATRGVKGQRARTGWDKSPGFEGGQTPLVRRLPKLGGFKNPNRREFLPINVSDLNIFDNGATVDSAALYAARLLKRKNAPIKILGGGELTKKLIVSIDRVSGSAKTKIENAGGSVKELMVKA